MYEINEKKLFYYYYFELSNKLNKSNKFSIKLKDETIKHLEPHQPKNHCYDNVLWFWNFLPIKPIAINQKLSLWTKCRKNTHFYYLCESLILEKLCKRCVYFPLVYIKLSLNEKTFFILRNIWDFNLKKDFVCSVLIFFLRTYLQICFLWLGLVQLVRTLKSRFLDFLPLLWA